MSRYYLTLVLFSFASCAPTRPADDGFRARLSTGCGTEQECLALEQAAKARFTDCWNARDRDCSAEREDKTAAERLHLDRWQQASAERMQHVNENATARERANAEERERTMAAAKAQHEQTEEADCASDRDVRMDHLQKRKASIAHINELIDWESAHCKTVDRGKPVVRTLQDSRGKFHTVERIEGPVDRVCDAKLPDEIAHTEATKLPTYQVPHALELRNLDCKKRDIAASTIAADYYNVR